jgi:hypothetical protein
MTSRRSTRLHERRSAKPILRSAAPSAPPDREPVATPSVATVDRRPNHPVGVMPAHHRGLDTYLQPMVGVLACEREVR